jgi:hypothetical protein
MPSIKNSYSGHLVFHLPSLYQRMIFTSAWDCTLDRIYGRWIKCRVEKIEWKTLFSWCMPLASWMFTVSLSYSVSNSQEGRPLSQFVSKLFLKASKTVGYLFIIESSTSKGQFCFLDLCWRFQKYWNIHSLIQAAILTFLFPEASEWDRNIYWHFKNAPTYIISSFIKPTLPKSHYFMQIFLLK